MTTDPPATSDAPSSAPVPQGDIVARAGQYYRNTRYIMFALLVGMGGWFAYDGWVKYPAENAVIAKLKTDQADATARRDDEQLGKIAAELKKHEEHNDTSLLIQRLLGFALPPVGLFVLWWAFRNSRGEYRMSGTKISVPGHPTIDLTDIKSVNNDMWDRKGIAWVKYELSDGRAGEIRLDDFVYDRPPIDAIYDRIAAHMGIESDEDESTSTEEEKQDDAPVP